MRGDLRLEAVVTVRSTDAEVSSFGSAFIVRHDRTSTFLVTCAHVVRDVGGDARVQVAGRPARVIAIGSPDGGDDLAVLTVDRLDLPVLRLSLTAETGRAVAAVGVRPVRAQVGLLVVEPLEATLGALVALDSPTGRVRAWRLLTPEGGLVRGYSGSPVVDAVTGEVVGVAAYRGDEQRGLAIAAETLATLWPQGFTALTAATVTHHGVQFCYVPAGPFSMGTPERRALELAEQAGYDGFLAEAPDHRVELDGFYIARLPVTNREYADFLHATGRPVPYRADEYSLPHSWNPAERSYPEGKANFPVVLVSWQDARNYAAWRGARLPTEAEWEKAARGTDRRAWPWGDAWNESRCNTAESGRRRCLPVGEFSPGGDSPFGVADLSGNVWEWCSTVFEAYPYSLDSREDANALGDRVLRGGAWGNNRWLARCAARRHAPAEDFGFTIGFRLAIDSDAVDGKDGDG